AGLEGLAVWLLLRQKEAALAVTGLTALHHAADALIAFSVLMALWRAHVGVLPRPASPRNGGAGQKGRVWPHGVRDSRRSAGGRHAPDAGVGPVGPAGRVRRLLPGNYPAVRPRHRGADAAGAVLSEAEMARRLRAVHAAPGRAAARQPGRHFADAGRVLAGPRPAAGHGSFAERLPRAGAGGSAGRAAAGAAGAGAQAGRRAAGGPGRLGRRGQDVP